MKKVKFFPLSLFSSLNRRSWGKSVSPWLLVCTPDVDEWADIQNSTANNSRQPPPPHGPKRDSLNKYNTKPVFWCNSNILILMIPATTYCRVWLIVMILIVFQTSPNFLLCISDMQRQSLTEKLSTLFIHVIFCTPKTEFCLNKLKICPHDKNISSSFQKPSARFREFSCNE